MTLRFWSADAMSNTVHVFDFLAQPLTQPPVGVCAIFGGKRFLKKLATDYLVRSIGGDDLDFAASQYDGQDKSLLPSWADVHDELATRSLFGGDGPKIVVVDHADDFVSEHRDRIESFASGAGGTGLLVLVVDSWAANTRLFKQVDKTGFQVRCDEPKMGGRSKKPDLKKISDWLMTRSQSVYEFQLPASGAQWLIDLTECEFGRMDQELQKLALYADSDGKVDIKTIKKVVGGWRARTMWEAIDAAVDGEAGKALDSLDLLFRSDEHPLALFGQLSWSLRRYGIATETVYRQMRNRQKPNIATAAQEAGFTKWENGIELAQTRLRQLGSARAKQILDWLLEADLQLKRSHSHKDRGRLVLEKLVVKMAKELAPSKS